MYRPGSPTTAQQVFQATRILHLLFLAASLMYVLLGEMIRLLVEDFSGGGFIGLGDEVWLARAGIIAYALAFTFGPRLISDDSRIASMVREDGKADDGVIAKGLQTALILRLAFAEAIATSGLMLYLVGGNRLDLYVSAAIAIVAFFFFRPTREQWQEAFQDASLRYEGVSSDPWAAA